MLTKINVEDLRKFLDEKEKESDKITLHEMRDKISRFEDLETIKSLTAMAPEQSQDLAFRDYIFCNVQKFGGEVSALWKSFLKQKK